MKARSPARPSQPAREGSNPARTQQALPSVQVCLRPSRQWLNAAPGNRASSARSATRTIRRPPARSRRRFGVVGTRLSSRYIGEWNAVPRPPRLEAATSGSCPESHAIASSGSSSSVSKRWSAMGMKRGTSSGSCARVRVAGSGSRSHTHESGRMPGRRDYHQLMIWGIGMRPLRSSSALPRERRPVDRSRWSCYG